MIPVQLLIAVILAVSIGLSFAGCKRAEHPSDPTEVAAASSGTLTPERRAELEEGRRQDMAADARDHAELVRPAPAGFRLEATRTKLTMKLVLERSRIKKGEAVRYRVEIQNVAREPFVFTEWPHSFVKDGSLSDTPFKAYLADSRGKWRELEPRLGGMAEVYEFRLPNDKYLTEDQRAEAIADLNREAASKRTLLVTLQPGETLVTRGDPPGSGYRPLRCDLGELAPGRYSLRFSYEDSQPEGVEDVPDAPMVHEMKSAAVSFEVTR